MRGNRRDLLGVTFPNPSFFLSKAGGLKGGLPPFQAAKGERQLGGDRKAPQPFSQPQREAHGRAPRKKNHVADNPRTKIRRAAERPDYQQ